MFRSTTILAVRHRDKAVLAGDGQVTFGQTVVKQGARKIRRLYNDRILAGFAGSAADSFALFSRFESKLEQYRGNLERSAVELAKDWRSDRFLRRLEAMLIVLDKNAMFLLSGTGDLIEPDDGIVGIGSGGPFALAAARALAKHTELDQGVESMPPVCHRAATPAVVRTSAQAAPSQWKARPTSLSHNGSPAGIVTSIHTAAPGSTRTAAPPLRRWTTSTPRCRTRSQSTTSSFCDEPSTSVGRATSSTTTLRSPTGRADNRSPIPTRTVSTRQPVPTRVNRRRPAA